VSEILNQFITALRGLLDNQLVGGGLVLMFVGSVIALLRNLPTQLWSLLKRQFTVHVDILSTDALFGWTIAWLNEHPYSKRARRLSASTDDERRKNQPSVMGDSNEGVKPEILFSPAPGLHVLWVGGRPMWLNRDREKPTGEKGSWSIFTETITIGAFGRDPTPIRQILEDARDLAYTDEKLVGIYVSRYGDWYRIHEVVPRTLASVILPEGVSEGLLQDIRVFLASEEWYAERGIPWRRGFLFEGIPGTGKTSIVTALAGEVGMDLYICNITDNGMDDERLMASLLNVKAHSAVLLEDVDGLVSGRDIKTENGVTFSGLLNALDGVASRPGIITFMTTNHSDKLDPALVRSGRVDRREVFTFADEEQANRFIERFYRGSKVPPSVPAFAQEPARTIADIQGVLMAHRDNPTAAMKVFGKGVL